MGMLVLIRSILSADTSRDLVVLSTVNLNEEERLLLLALGCKIRKIEAMKEFYFEGGQCPYLKDMDNSQRWQRWGQMFSKLRLWQLVEYDKVLYLDADIIALPRISQLFQYPEMTAEKGLAHDFFNCGYMILNPSQRTFDDMVSKAATGKPPDLFHNVIDCTEQGFLNGYYPKFNDVPIGRPDIDNIDVFVESRSASYPSAPLISTTTLFPMIHYVKMQCGKPWEWTKCQGGFLQGACFLPTYYLWWKQFLDLDAYLRNHDQSSVSEISPVWEDFKRRVNIAIPPWEALDDCTTRVGTKNKNKRLTNKTKQNKTNKQQTKEINHEFEKRRAESLRS